MTHPENQDWQRVCVKCGKVKCPKVEKVAEWMRGLLDRAHDVHMKDMGSLGLHWALGLEGSHITIAMEVWSRGLEGVCSDCVASVAPPEVVALLDDPEELLTVSVNRWKRSVPEVASDSVNDAVQALIDTTKHSPADDSPAS